MSQGCGGQSCAVCGSPKLSVGHSTATPLRMSHNRSIASPEDARTIDAFRFVALEREKDPWRDGSTIPVATTRETYKKDITTPLSAPAWDIMENKVLRFFSYFNEHVDDSRAENYRSRPCEILYYLEDDTMEIVEPKIDNSGMNSGSLIKRHRFPDATDPDKLVSPADLRVGTAFTAYGKTFAITACDAFTREWYRISGISQPSDCKVELSGNTGYSRSRIQSELRTQKASPTTDKQCIDEFYKRIESPEPVCRFRAFFDDNFTNVIERRMYTILYFPRDDTMEIRENLPPLGGNRFTIFISRRKLLKGNVLSEGPSFPRPPDAAYFELLDFKVGSVVTIADRDFYIYAADPFTMSYFKDKLHAPLQEPINVDSFEMPSKPSTPAKLINPEKINSALSKETRTAGEKLLQKSIYFNEDAGRPFEAGDFVVGRLWDGLRGNDIKSGQMFTACDERRKGFLTFQDFQIALERFGYSITEQDALLISRYFDSTGDGKVDYEEFCTGMLELQGAFLSNSQRLSETLHSNIEAYKGTAKIESTRLEDTKAIKQSFKQLQSRLYQQPRLLQLLTKEFSRSSLGRKVSVDEAVGVFDRCGLEVNLPGSVMAARENILPLVATDKVIWDSNTSKYVCASRSRSGNTFASFPHQRLPR
ncbi:hypothetical protein EBH_0028330 [Eimeria brunetti]|uniref:Uncharacterized protein n=1 Tax=Eimeria brunetti TaxID=51314 RepID=U6LH95_9EIME|nr:hypothetical protein EBH_0028330 [Eimeria brunetti]